MTTPTREQALAWAREARVITGTDEEWSVPVGGGMPDRLVKLASLAYAAGAASMRDCRTCRHIDGRKTYCRSVGVCENGSNYSAQVPLQMWRKE